MRELRELVSKITRLERVLKSKKAGGKSVYYQIALMRAKRERSTGLTRRDYGQTR